MKQLFSAFIIGIIVCFFALKSCDNKPPEINVKEIKKEIKDSDNTIETLHQNFQKENEVFKRAVDSLRAENETLSVKLQTARSLLKKQQTKVEQTIAQSNIPCDSLRKDVIVLNQLSNAEDSLCSRTISSLIAAVTVRDSQIVICNRNYESLYDIQKANLQRQEQLANELNIALKVNRKKFFENKALTFGLVIMAGITTSLFIKSQQ
jgi:hypothetical protein